MKAASELICNIAGNEEGVDGSEPLPYKPLKELLLQRSSAEGAVPAHLAEPQVAPEQERAQAPQLVNAHFAWEIALQPLHA